MKKVAYLGNSLTNCLLRAEAYLKNLSTQEIEFTYVIVENLLNYPHSLEDGPAVEYLLPYEVKYCDLESFKSSSYDLVMVGSDKYFKILLDRLNLTKTNLTDKFELASICHSLGINFPSTLNVDIIDFDDDDFVFVKPKISSGSYSPDDFCYRKIKFRDVKDKITTNHLVQKFFDSTNSLVFSFASNGESLYFIDCCDYRCYYDEDSGKMMSAGTDATCEAYASIVRDHRGFINSLFELLRHSKYNLVPGFYNLQACVVDGEAYLYDVNMRTGPISVTIEKYEMSHISYYDFIELYMSQKNDYNLTAYAISDQKLVSEYFWISRLKTTNKFLSEDLSQILQQVKRNKLVKAEKTFSEKKTSGILNNITEVQILTF
jgi:hypothetical protein